MSNSSSSGGSSGLFVMGCIFVVLKLMGVIDWSWWWVTIPFWIGLAIAVGFMVAVPLLTGLGIGLFLGGAWLIDRIREFQRTFRKGP